MMQMTLTVRLVGKQLFFIKRYMSDSKNSSIDLQNFRDYKL